jgi:methylated-DNA-[protein]-cysteine S-methyltransferase
MLEAGIAWRTMASPVGTLTLVAREASLTGVWFATSRHPMPPLPPTSDTNAATIGVLDETERQLNEYFAGERRVFDLPLQPEGTSFQLRVWTALREIPFGETRSYGDLARALGKANGARAVGSANGQNPIPIIVPCHRVIGGSGSLVGFGGGIEAKRWLLAHERPDELTLF